MTVIDTRYLKVPRALDVNQLNQTSQKLEVLSREQERALLEEETNFHKLKDDIENANLAAQVANCKIVLIRSLLQISPDKRDYDFDTKLVLKKTELIEKGIQTPDELSLLPLSEKPDEEGGFKLKLKAQKADEPGKKIRIINKLHWLFEIAQKQFSDLNRDTDLGFWEDYFVKEFNNENERYKQLNQKLEESVKRIEKYNKEARALEEKKQELRSLAIEHVAESKDIFKASELGCIDVVEDEIKKKPTLANEKNSQGFTPLHLAAAHGQLAAVVKLLELGANPAIEDPEKNLPLHWAAKIGHVPIAIALIVHKDHLKHKNVNGRTPLHFAAYYSGKAEIVTFLLSQGAHINDQAKELNSVSPLHDAAMKGHKEAVEALVKDERLEPNITDAKGLTPFQYAANARFFEVAACISMHPRWKSNLLNTKLNEAVALIYAFLIRNKTNSENNFEKEITRSILPLIPATPEERCQFAQKVGSAFHLANQNKDQNIVRIKRLKKELKETLNAPNWESGVLRARTMISAFRKPHKDSYLNYNNAIDCPIEFNQRARFSNPVQSPIALANGSTPSTNIPHLVNLMGEHLFTAIYGDKCHDEQGQFNGYAFGLAEGVDKRSDLYLDRKVRKIAYITARTCVRFMTAYNTADKLYSDLQSNIGIIEKRIWDLIPANEKNPKENKYLMTLLGCRILPTPNGYHIVSLNVGHNMLVAWHPVQKKAYFLSSHTQESGKGSIPGSYKPHQIAIQERVVPRGCLLFMISKGLHDFLAAEEKIIPIRLTDDERKRRPHGADNKEAEYEKVHVRVLTQLEAIFNHIHRDNSSLFLRALVQKGLEGAEAKRRELLGQNSVKIGDDFAVLQCVLE